MHTEPASRPWRSYVRFSLRGLIVLVLVIAAGMGWIVRQARLQRENETHRPAISGRFLPCLRHPIRIPVSVP